MNTNLIYVALIAGGATWAFRVLPILLMRGDMKPTGLFARFLATTGPAAIATLFVASILPQLYPAPRELGPLAVGIIATVVAFLPQRSVVFATLSGAVAYGAAFALLG